MMMKRFPQSAASAVGLRGAVTFGMAVLSLVVAKASAASVQAVTFESGVTQTALVELFTSEGCSSCPPAEARLTKLRNDPGLWKDFVPVAFHVNYWDRLGWPDRFASPVFTQRQRDYAAGWRADSVYTPAFVRNGREGYGMTPVAMPGSLRADISAAGRVTVTFQPISPVDGPFVIELAPLTGEVTTDVRRGENAGRTLAHEFVALALLNAPLKREAGRWTGHLDLPANTIAPIQAVAVWVHSANNAIPLQAVGGWLKK